MSEKLAGVTSVEAKGLKWRCRYQLGLWCQHAACRELEFLLPNGRRIAVEVGIPRYDVEEGWGGTLSAEEQKTAGQSSRNADKFSGIAGPGEDKHLGRRSS